MSTSWGLRVATLEALSPTVAVLTTPDAESLLQRQEVGSFVQLLTAHGSSLQRRHVVRVGPEQAQQLELTEYRFKAVWCRELAGVEETALERELAGAIAGEHEWPTAAAAAMSLASLVPGARPGHGRLSPSLLRPPTLSTRLTPWFDAYRAAYLRSMPASSHEGLFLPQLLLVLVSVASPDPPAEAVRALQQWLVQEAPASVRELLQDASAGVPRHYVLLYAPDAPAPLVEERFAQMRAQLGAGACHRLTASTAALQHELPDLTLELAYRALLPSLEARARHLLDAVQARRGLSNKVRRWFFGGGGGSKGGSSSEAPGSPSAGSDASSGSSGGGGGSAADGGYAVNGQEWQTRALADTLFLLRDWEGALGWYRAAANEFRSDKSGRYLGAALEQLAVCLLLTAPASDLPRRAHDAAQELERACQAYARAGPAYARFALRASLQLLEAERLARNAPAQLQVALRAAEAPGTDDVSSALLLEQAALCLLQQLQQPRRAALRFAQAGQRFGEARCGLEAHAQRCLRQAQQMLEGRDWRHLDALLGQELSRHAFLLARPEDALALCSRLLCLPLPPARQASALRELLHLLASVSGPGRELPALPVPDLPPNAIRVFLPSAPGGTAPTASTSAERQELALPEQLWHELADALQLPASAAAALPGAPSGSSPQIPRARPATPAAVAEARQVAVLEEPIEVELLLRNPLQVPLQLHQLHLQAAFTAPTSPDPALPDSQTLAGEQSQSQSQSQVPPAGEAPAAAAAAAAYEVIPVDVVLGPGERRTVRLCVRPLREGRLELRGLAFALAPGLWARRELPVRRRRLNETKEQRAAPGGAYREEPLVFEVCAPMPRLEVQLRGLPRQCLLGELLPLELLLRNAGRVALRGLRVRLSHPSFFAFGFEPPAAATVAELQDPRLVRLPGVELEAGAETCLALHLRADLPGEHALALLFAYESARPNPALPVRLTGFARKLLVQPSLRLHHQLQPSARSLQAHLLTLDVENASDQPLRLRQISCLSREWHLEPLGFRPAARSAAGPDAETAEAVLPALQPRESASLLMRLEPLAGGPAATPQHSLLLLRSGPALDAQATPYREFARQAHQAQFLARHGEPEGGARLFTPRHRRHASQMEARLEQLTRALQEESGETAALDLVLFFDTPNVPSAFLQLVRLLPSPSASLHPPPAAPTGVIGADGGRSGGDGVRCVIESAARVKHRFSEAGSLCAVPVRFRFRNQSARAASFSFEALRMNATGAGSSEAGGSGSRSHYFWAGQTRALFLDVPPRAERHHDLLVCFTRPGLYNINRFRIDVLPAPSDHFPPSHAAAPVGFAPSTLPPPTSAPVQELFPAFQHLIVVEEV